MEANFTLYCLHGYKINLSLHVEHHGQTFYSCLMYIILMLYFLP